MDFRVILIPIAEALFAFLLLPAACGSFEKQACCARFGAADRRRIHRAWAVP